MEPETWSEHNNCAVRTSNLVDEEWKKATSWRQTVSPAEGEASDSAATRQPRRWWWWCRLSELVRTTAVKASCKRGSACHVTPMTDALHFSETRSHSKDSHSTFRSNSNLLNFDNTYDSIRSYCSSSVTALNQVTADSCHRITSTSCLRRTKRRGLFLSPLWNTLFQTVGLGRRRRFRFSTLFQPSFLNMYIRVTTLILIVSTVLRTTEACSSRSTPKPRPPSPTLRPNITFPTFACPPAYATWYCLNGATCFTVEISESILYNCVCAEGFTGPRCEFKDLDGSYLPSREKVMIEKASIASGVTIAVLLMVIISIAVYIYSRRRKKDKSSDQIDAGFLTPRPFTTVRSSLTRKNSELQRGSAAHSHPDVEAGSNIHTHVSRGSQL